MYFFFYRYRNGVCSTLVAYILTAPLRKTKRFSTHEVAGHSIHMSPVLILLSMVNLQVDSLHFLLTIRLWCAIYKDVSKLIKSIHLFGRLQILASFFQRHIQINHQGARIRASFRQRQSQHRTTLSGNSIPKFQMHADIHKVCHTVIVRSRPMFTDLYTSLRLYLYIFLTSSNTCQNFFFCL